MIETSVHGFRKGTVGIWGAEICLETRMKGLFTSPAPVWTQLPVVKNRDVAALKTCLSSTSRMLSSFGFNSTGAIELHSTFSQNQNHIFWVLKATSMGRQGIQLRSSGKFAFKDNVYYQIALIFISSYHFIMMHLNIHSVPTLYIYISTHFQLGWLHSIFNFYLGDLANMASCSNARVAFQMEPEKKQILMFELWVHIWPQLEVSDKNTVKELKCFGGVLMRC